MADKGADEAAKKAKKEADKKKKAEKKAAKADAKEAAAPAASAAPAAADKKGDDKKKKDKTDKKKDAGAATATATSAGATAAAAPADSKDQKGKPMTERKENNALRAKIDDLLLRRFFYCPAFEIHGSVGGLYDYGPPGCAVKDALLSFWRQHFVLTENMLEIAGTSLTPHSVLKTSGHVDRFTDFMVKDLKTEDCFRADKLVEDHIDIMLEAKGLTQQRIDELKKMKTNAGASDAKTLDGMIKSLGVKAPETGNDLGEAYAFNLMFGTQIGPTGKFQGYLRPETAQGIFVNFRRLLDANGGRMPFAAAQIGHAFRNEISPRMGLLRVREFVMSEIEHFVNPNDKRHAKFKEVADFKLNLLSQADQTGADISREWTVGDAVKQGVINNETLAYFMVRTHKFLVAAGIKPSKLRFRQHKKDEMAHYAKDCWDAEAHTTFGWVEIVGHADRAAYDLEAHSRITKQDMTAYETYDAPREMDVAKVKLEKGKLGPKFGAASKALINHLEKLDRDAVLALGESLSKTGSATVSLEGKEYVLTPDLVKTYTQKEKVSGYKYIPSVIEPSFGIGRIMYSIFEHSYTQRDPNDEKRSYLALPAIIAPIKVAILPMSSDEKFEPFVNALVKGLLLHNLATKTDTSSVALGRKYARADEIGTPFACTVDFETEKDNSVTIRERDSMTQIRVPIPTAIDLCFKLCTLQTTWEEVTKKHPLLARKADDS